MNIFRLAALVLSVSCVVYLSALSGGHAQTDAQRAAKAREDAYRANNLGVALLEQYKYKEGAEAFTRALQLDPKLQLARINLSIALFNVPDLASAQREAEKAVAANQDAPQPHYILGLIAKSQNRVEDAIAAFQRVLKIDPRDTGANVNLGQLYAQQRKYAEAIATFRAAINVEPYNMTALYNLGLALTRNNERAEGQQMIARFQQLRQSGAGTTIGQNYLEQGRYAEALASTGAEADLVDKRPPEVKFTDATESMLPATESPGDASKNNASRLSPSIENSVTLFDYDIDGRLDLLSISSDATRLYHNEGGRFVDVTTRSGAFDAKSGGRNVCGVAGDYDNDGKPDLFIVRDNSLALYRNDGNGKFMDVTAASGIPRYPYLSISAAFVDMDHDGDLDVFIAGFADLSKPLDASKPVLNIAEHFAGAPNMLLRNDGNGKFTDVTAAAKVGSEAKHAVAIVPTDYDNRRDVDLLVVNYGAPSDLFSNQRDGSFRNVAREVGLDSQGHGTTVAAGDINKDGFTDFFFAGMDAAGLFAISDGRGRFKSVGAPASTKDASATQFLDYDNDGLLDCVTLTSAGINVLRNTGSEWADVTSRAVDTKFAAAIDASTRTMASGDIDGDGDTDLILRARTGDLRIARNDGGGSNRSLRVNLYGKVSNRSGIGAKVEARAGSLVQKLETYSANPSPAPADVLFGLGKREQADAVRVLWPAGIVQAETDMAAARSSSTDPKKGSATLSVTELDRKPSSCPFLYAWNGERFEFVTDFMGGGEMGYWEAPGHYNTPDPVEYVRIRSDQLKERDGRFELRVTNELEEVLYLDRLQLIAVAHPSGVEVYPNEGMTARPRPFKLHTTAGARPPLAATDEHGHDVLSRIKKMDRQYPDDFPLERIRGYAGEHTLTLKLDAGVRKSARTLLLLTGWTDYAFSSDNVAASHAGLQMKPPALQVKDKQNRWRTVIEDMGIPVGRPQTVTVDLTGIVPAHSREVRIVTSMRIYWDQILVDTSSGGAPFQMTRLDPLTASLRWRGYSREVTPDGREPFLYDYEKVSSASPWKVMPGRYTREGEVRELLIETDDIFVISRTGDEVSLSFDARGLPPLPRGWTRTFLLYSDGFSKEMDINSASPDQVTPLPFHGMTRYPYRAPEAYPLTQARRNFLETYNTRIVTAPIPMIVMSNE